MKVRTTIDERATPGLRRGVRLSFDRLRGRWVLMAPERILVPDVTALDILRGVNGARSVGALIDALVAEYDAPRAVVAEQTIAFIQQLADLGYLTT